MTAKVVIFGTGYSASVASYYLTHDSPWQVVGFTAEDEFLVGTSFEGLPAVPFRDVSRCFPPTDHCMTIQVSYRGVNQVRARLYDKAKAAGYRLISYISSRAAVWPDLTVGENTFVLDRAVVQPFARLGNNVTVCSGASVGHHALVEDHSFLAPNCAVLGFVTVGSHCVLGANSSVRDGIRVGSHSFVGANVFVSRDTPPESVYVAPEAKRLARSSLVLSRWLVRTPPVPAREAEGESEKVAVEEPQRGR